MLTPSHLRLAGRFQQQIECRFPDRRPEQMGAGSVVLKVGLKVQRNVVTAFSPLLPARAPTFRARSLSHRHPRDEMLIVSGPRFPSTSENLGTGTKNELRVRAQPYDVPGKKTCLCVSAFEMCRFLRHGNPLSWLMVYAGVSVCGLHDATGSAVTPPPSVHKRKRPRARWSFWDRTEVAGPSSCPWGRPQSMTKIRPRHSSVRQPLPRPASPRGRGPNRRASRLSHCDSVTADICASEYGTPVLFPERANALHQRYATRTRYSRFA